MLAMVVALVSIGLFLWTKCLTSVSLHVYVLCMLYTNNTKVFRGDFTFKTGFLKNEQIGLCPFKDSLRRVSTCCVHFK